MKRRGEKEKSRRDLWREKRKEEKRQWHSQECELGGTPLPTPYPPLPLSPPLPLLMGVRGITLSGLSGLQSLSPIKTDSRCVVI